MKPMESTIEAKIMAKLYDVLHEVVQGQDVVLQNYINSAQEILTQALSMGLVVSKAPEFNIIPDVLFDQTAKLQAGTMVNMVNADQSLEFKKRLQALPIEKASILPPNQKLDFGKCLLSLEVTKEYVAFESLVNFHSQLSSLTLK